MGKTTDSLIFNFGVIFAVFTLLAVALSGVITFNQQTAIYKAEQEENIQQVADHLDKLILQDGDDFLIYTKYMTSHFNEIQIPVEFNREDVLAAGEKFQAMFAQAYPAKVFGRDVSFDEMSEELKKAYVVYQHEFYLLEFEEARESFDIIYTYLCVPTGEPLHMYYMIDVERIPRESDGFMNLCDDIYEAPEAHARMWEAWNTGKKATGYDTYDNEFGKTYAYYSPLTISGEKIGVIGVEVEIANVNKAILHNSIRQIALVGTALVVLVVLLLLYIYRRYIAKLEHIKKSVRAYTQNKDVSIADDISREANGDDEISILATQVSSMILEIENYMKSLLETAKALHDTQQRADAMNELAMKDALTGIRNKTSYDAEVKKIEWKMNEDNCVFAIAMIDLNFLKRLNDTFGHDKGNIAIKKLCYIVCHVFEHSPVFRIGGDEFVLILQGDDFTRREELCAIFNRKIAEMANDKYIEPWERVSASIGVAVYDSAIDSNVDNVFKRADKAMYAHKKEMKATREA